MIYVYKDRIINIEWTILKGTSNVKENFDRALVKLFLIGPHEKYLLQANTKDGVVSAEIPQGFPEGVYSVELIYIKNWLGVDRPPKISDRYPIDCRGNSRCIMRSRKDYLFAITEYESEATNIGDGEVVIRLKTSTASYGYDGLSAYEIAVMRGDFNGSEGEWLEYIYGNKKWEERFIFYLKKHIDNNTIYWDEKNKVIKAKGGTPEPDIYILYGNILDEITSFSQITLEMLESSTNHIIKIKPQTLPKTSLGTLQAGSKVVVLIPNGHEYVATKDNGIGGKVPFDESIMGANGQSINLGNNLYKIYGEFMTVSGEIFIYID